MLFTTGLPTSPRQTTLSAWDGLEALWGILLAVVGTIYTYRQNGGAEGRHFLQRYFAVGWVVSVRWLAVSIPVSTAFYTESTHWYDPLFFAVVAAGFYWRMAHHVKDLAQRATAV